MPEEAAAIDDDWMIIWNDGSGTQTKDLKYKNQHLYTGADKNTIAATTKITAICETTDIPSLLGETEGKPLKWLMNGRLYIQVGNQLYDATGRLITTGGDGILPVQ